jgi:hypothetical protein
VPPPFDAVAEIGTANAPALETNMPRTVQRATVRAFMGAGYAAKMDSIYSSEISCAIAAYLTPAAVRSSLEGVPPMSTKIASNGMILGLP